MYFDGEFLEKKMSSNLLDLPRVETRDADYIERARRLAPLLKEAADEIEEQRQLPQRVVEALIDGGFFKLLIPRSLGGAELHPLTYVQVLEEIAKAEPSRPPGASGRIRAARCRPPISTRRWRARSSGRRAASSPGARNCRAPAAASRSRAASALPGAGVLPPAAGTRPGSARMSRFSRRTARRG